MKAKFINESEGIPWSGEDPTKASVIGKVLTRRIKLENGEEMKPEILEIVEVNDPYYVVNKWYKPKVPQIIHSDMIYHYIPIQNYKDEDLEDRTLNDNITPFNEVSKSDDKWANDQLDKFAKGKEIGRQAISSQDKDDKEDITVPEYSWVEEPTPPSELTEIERLAMEVIILEDWILDNGTDADKDIWQKKVTNQIGERNIKTWIQFDEDEIELLRGDAHILINKIKRR